MDNNSSLILKALTTGYGEKAVTRDINATLEHSQLVALLGPNGVGKSTLLRTLCGFQPSLAGEVIICGRKLSEMSPSQLSRTIGVVLTERPDVQNMTVRDMVGMGRSPYTGFWGRLTPEDEAQVEKAMQLTGITPLAERMIDTLSDGERQKVMIAKALAQETPIILLDEPTAFLDFPSKVEMMRLLGRLAHSTEKTVFLSTHDVEMALQLADRLWLMTAQGLVTGSPRELAENGNIASFIQTDGLVFDQEKLTISILKE